MAKPRKSADGAQPQDAVTTPSRRFLRTNEVLEMLGVGRTTLHELVVRGELPAARHIGAAAVWPLSDIEAFMDKVEART